MGVGRWGLGEGTGRGVATMNIVAMNVAKNTHQSVIWLEVMLLKGILMIDQSAILIKWACPIIILILHLSVRVCVRACMRPCVRAGGDRKPFDLS